MKNLVYKVLAVSLVIGLGIIIYFLNSSEKSLEKINETNSSSLDNNYVNNNNSQISAFVPNDIADKELNTNIDNLNKVLSETREMLKNHNKNSSSTIISNKEIDKLLVLENVSEKTPPKKLLAFDSKDTTNNKNTDNTKKNLTYNTNDVTNNTTTPTDTSTTPQDTTPTNQIDPQVSSEIIQLQSEIGAIKQVIDKLTSNQL